MLTSKILRAMGKVKIAEAEALFEKEFYDGAIYISGYAVEYYLKARIADALKFSEYPPFKGKDYDGFRVHKLIYLLEISGRKAKLQGSASHLADWNLVSGKWDSDMRYNPLKFWKASERASMQADKIKRKQSARDFINAVKNLTRIL